jgi:Ribonuclease G/E
MSDDKSDKNIKEELVLTCPHCKGFIIIRKSIMVFLLKMVNKLIIFILLL